MYDHLLVPTDGSTGTTHAAMHALDLAAHHDARVTTISVIDTSISTALRSIAGSREELERLAEHATKTVATMGRAHDIDVMRVVKDGDPAETIVEYAAENDVDVVVMGTHGRTGLDHALLGSVTERVVRNATVPVLTVRLADTDVTVEDEETAAGIARNALDAKGLEDAALDEPVERQLAVWVAEATHPDGTYLVYIDPVTQRASVVGPE